MSKKVAPSGQTRENSDDIKRSFEGVKSYYKAGKEVQAALEPMRNPVTGAETHAKIVLLDALVCNELNVTSTKSFAVFADGLKFAAPGKNAWYGSVEHGT